MPNYILGETGDPILEEADTAGDQKILEELDPFTLSGGVIVAKTYVP